MISVGFNFEFLSDRRRESHTREVLSHRSLGASRATVGLAPVLCGPAPSCAAPCGCRVSSRPSSSLHCPLLGQHTGEVEDRIVLRRQPGGIWLRRYAYQYIERVKWECDCDGRVERGPTRSQAGPHIGWAGLSFASVGRVRIEAARRVVARLAAFLFFLLRLALH